MQLTPSLWRKGLLQGPPLTLLLRCVSHSVASFSFWKTAELYTKVSYIKGEKKTRKDSSFYEKKDLIMTIFKEFTRKRTSFLLQFAMDAFWVLPGHLYHIKKKRKKNFPKRSSSSVVIKFHFKQLFKTKTSLSCRTNCNFGQDQLCAFSFLFYRRRFTYGDCHSKVRSVWLMQLFGLENPHDAMLLCLSVGNRVSELYKVCVVSHSVIKVLWHELTVVTAVGKLSSSQSRQISQWRKKVMENQENDF